MILLEADNVSKSWLQSSLTLSLEEQKVIALKGENGSGKTTLLKICAGLLDNDQGTLKKQARIGWSDSTLHGCLEQLTGNENIDLYSSILKSKVDHERVQKWKENLESFSKVLETPLIKASTGMKKLLSLYLSTLHTPDVLIWDEPFSSLSQKNSLYLLSHWQELTLSKGIIFSHHGDDLPSSLEVISL